LVHDQCASGCELQRFVASEIAGWGKIVCQVGIAGTE
jgi:hypothetical protein